MAHAYDSHYQTIHLFGDAYPELETLVSNLPRSLRWLDVGCGQGRDVFKLASLGFSASGLDVSHVGLTQAQEEADRLGFAVTFLHGEMETFHAWQDYDAFLFDSMFHFYKKDRVNEQTFLRQVIHAIRDRSYVLFFIQDHANKRRWLHETIFDAWPSMTLVRAMHFRYEKFNAPFYGVLYQKT